MSSFSDRYSPRPTPLGDEIPAGVRRAIAAWFEDKDVPMVDVRRQFFQKMGYSNARDVARDVEDRWGQEAAWLLERDLGEDPDVLSTHPAGRHETATAVVLFHAPAPLFLDVIEDAIALLFSAGIDDALDYHDEFQDLRLVAAGYLNGLFARRGISYRFDPSGRAEWHGDQGAYREVIAPALAVVADPYLEAPRDEFTAALRHLRAGTPKDEEDAIEEAAKAVESMMKIVLNEGGVDTSAKTAEPLWNLLREGSDVAVKAKDAVLAASRLRNEYGGHGAGHTARAIPEGVAALAVHAAAGAIVYLATLLPPGVGGR